MKDSNIYILTFKDKNYLKIGKADDVFTRIKNFKYLGDIDFDNSYFFNVSSREEALKNESVLHHVFESYRFQSELSGDGSSELFDRSIIDDLLKTVSIVFKIQDIAEYKLSELDPRFLYEPKPKTKRVRFSGYFSEVESHNLTQIRCAFAGERLADNVIVRAAIRAATANTLRDHINDINVEDRRTR